MAKVVFKDFREAITVSLPSIKGSEISMYTSLLTGEMMDLHKKFPKMADSTNSDSQEGSYHMLVACIKEWNFTDEAGVDLPITNDTIKQLETNDFISLIGNIKVNNETSKKKV